MRPLKLTMSAFGPYAATVEVPFDELGERGIYLITGDTGAGKTTIFDAISYALFGETSDDDRPAAALRSDFAAPELLTEVELEFAYAGERYEIRRSPAQERPKRRGKGTTTHNPAAWLRLPGGEEVEGVTTVNEAIARILGMNARQFRQIAMIAQGKFRALLTSSSKDRGRIFRELFGTAPYEFVQYELKNRQSALFKADAEARTAISATLQLVDLMGTERVEAFGELAPHAAVRGEELLELIGAQERDDEVEEARLNAELKSLAESLGEVDRALEEAKRARRGLAELAEAKAQVTARETELARAKDAREQAEGFAPEISKLNLEVQTLTSSLAGLEELESATTSLSALAAEERALEAKLDDALKALVHAMGTDAPAPISQASASERLDEALRASQARLGALRTRAGELEGALPAHARAESELNALKGKREEVAARQKELADLEMRVRKAEASRESASQAYERARTRADEAHATYRTLERRFLDEQAGILAEDLEPGEPCPVCGSLGHPSPASRSRECPSEADVDRARARSERERDAAAEASKRAGEMAASAMALRESRASFMERYGSAEGLEGTLRDLRDKTVAKERDVERLHAQCVERGKALKDSGVLEASIQSVASARDEISARARELANRKASLSAQAETLRKGLPAESLAEARALMASATERIKLLEDARSKAQKSFEAASADLASAKTRVAVQEKHLEEIPEHDEDALGLQRKELASRQREVDGARDVVRARRSTNKRAMREFKGWLKRYARQLEEHAVIDALANTANGTLHGAAKVTFETFVQQTYLDRVIAAANRRLSVIANGRYELTRRRDPRNYQQQSGLELSVHDHRTGKERDVATLSGGESFEAALSLALGLSDVVQAHSGGIRLDTLFIDEGFGSLDSEALQSAIRMLTSLTPEDKLVGIISHVDALRESIDTRIVVSSGREGSSLTVEV